MHIINYIIIFESYQYKYSYKTVLIKDIMLKCLICYIYNTFEDKSHKYDSNYILSTNFRNK